MLKNVVKSGLASEIRRTVQGVLADTKAFGDERLLDEVTDAVDRLARDRNFSEAQRHGLLYAISRKLLPHFSINDRGRYFLKDQAFRAYFERFLGKTGNWLNYERRWTVGQMLRLLTRVPGHLAECGVYEGGASYQLCRFAEANGRRVHLFDSFEGLSSPNENDGDHWKRGALSSPEDVLRKNLSEFDCFETFPGWIPSAFDRVADQTYCFVHIDVDLEQPTYDSIAFFYPRLAPGGIMMLDDHGYETCPGARKAALEFMSDKPEPVVDLATGQGMILKT